jgi:cobalamin biosynthesis Mg chelatase CobN
MAVKLLGLAAMALLLSSCLKLNMDLTVSSKNTVSGTVIFAVDKQLLQASGQTVDQVLQSPVVSPGTKGVTTSPYDDGKYVGQEIVFDAVPLSQFAGASAEDLKIVREGDEFKVSGVLDLSSATPTTTGNPQVDQIAQQAMKTADLHITMTFPGSVTSSNGKVDGNSVTWEPKIGERTEIRAVASAIPSSSFPWLWIAIGAAAVVVLLVVALWIAARRRGEKGVEVPAAVGAAATGAAPSVSEAPAVGPIGPSEPPSETPGRTLPAPPPPPGQTP